MKKSLQPVFFSSFKPNPIYEDVLNARKCLVDSSCDCIVSVGGGSAIDTAKAVKLFLPLEDDGMNFIHKEHQYINFKHIAVPTTAGTGSESTKFSVIYYEGEKQSLSNPSMIPDLVVLDSNFLLTLPDKQKASTALDALCQATESLWSVNANEESRNYAVESIKLILANLHGYMEKDKSLFSVMQKAANLSGKAINITQTTAAHAMSYKITSLFAIPHGFAVAMCMLPVWRFYNEHLSECKNFDKACSSICEAYGTHSIAEAYDVFSSVFDFLNLKRKIKISREELRILVEEVNVIRLKNFPIALTSDDIADIYKEICI